MIARKIEFLVFVRDEQGKVTMRQSCKTKRKADKLISKLRLKGLDVLFF